MSRANALWLGWSLLAAISMVLLFDTVGTWVLAIPVLASAVAASVVSTTGSSDALRIGLLVLMCSVALVPVALVLTILVVYRFA